MGQCNVSLVAMDIIISVMHVFPHALQECIITIGIIAVIIVIHHV